MSARSDADVPSAVGTEVELEVGPVAHGGHFVARLEGRVVFVRHALPGELVRARLTEAGEGAGYWRADAVEVLRASADRVVPPCPWSGPGQCGGCDFQHVASAAQRSLKEQVVVEQMQRLAGLVVDVPVEAVDGEGVDVERGLRWRTRVQYAVDDAGRAGLRAHRSHEVVPIDDCRIATDDVGALDVTGRRWAGWDGVEAVAPAGGPQPLLVLSPTAGAHRRPRVPDVPPGTSVAVSTANGVDRVRGRTWVREQVDVGGEVRDFRITGSGFWQVHPGAAPVLVSAVLDALVPQPGERVLDLYAGAGLFAAALALRVGASGSVLAVEGSSRGIGDARRSLHDLPQVRLERGRVDAVLARLHDEVEADLVVLDPPRTGAGRRVVEQVVALAPRAIAYVACDPAALARDVAWFGERGYAMEGLRAFDIFPMTHHVECVAWLVPAQRHVLASSRG